MKNKEMQNLEIPILPEDHSWANKFASEQTTTEKGKQVYLNTLAVYAVHRYLQLLGIETDLKQCDCWNPILRHRWNVADLVIPNIGTLECRPVLPGETTIFLPSEVTENRLGYLAVQFTEDLDQVQLLGFTKAPVGEVIDVNRLGSLDYFIDAISLPPQPDILPNWLNSTSLSQAVNLSAWFDGIFDEVWLTIEEWLNRQQRVARTRKETSKDSKNNDRNQDSKENNQEIIGKVKEFTLGLSADSQQLNLVVSIRKEENQEIGCLFEIYPMKIGDNLPVGLKLKVILESVEAERKVEAGKAKKSLKIRLTEIPGKPITVQVHLNDEFITEEFIV